MESEKNFAFQPSGTEGAGHSIRAWLRADPERRVVISNDVRNAFNEMFRALIFKMAALLPHCEALTRTVYLGPGRVVWTDRDGVRRFTFQSQRGCIQGEVQAGTLFAMGHDLTLAELRTTDAWTSIVKIVTYQDNGYELGDVDSAFQAFDKVVELYQAAGLTMDLLKCEAFTFSTDPDVRARLEAACAQRGIKFTYSGLQVVGIPVGTDAYCEAFLQAILDKILRRIRLLSSPAILAYVMGKQPVLQTVCFALRLSIPAAFIFYIRTVPPRLSKPVAKALDEGLRAVVLQIVGQDPDSLAYDTKIRFGLPIRHGGAGFLRLESLAAIAYVASLHSVKHALLKVQPLTADTDPDPDVVVDDFTESLDELRVWLHLPSAVQLQEGRAFFLGEGGPGLQKTLSEELSQRLVREIDDHLVNDPQGRAAWKSITARHAGSWMGASPRLPYHRMEDAVYAYAFALRLGLPQPVYGRVPDYTGPASVGYVCPGSTCGPVALDGSGLHSFSCPLSRPAAASRHFLLVNGLTETCRQHRSRGIECIKEPTMSSLGFPRAPVAAPPPPLLPAAITTGLSEAQVAQLHSALNAEIEAQDSVMKRAENRADAHVSHAAVQNTVDVIVTHPNISKTPGAVTQRFAAANAAKEGKLGTYRRNGWDLAPVGTKSFLVLAFESYGAMHPDTEHFIQWLAHTVHPPQPGHADVDGLRGAFTGGLRQRLSVALMRGNYLIFERWVKNCLPDVLKEAVGP